MTLIETLERYVRGEAALDIADYAEVVLAGDGSNLLVAQAVLRVASREDGRAVLGRFLASIKRIYGPKWREWAALNANRSLICHETGCMELALNGICDRCLARGA